MLEEKLDSRYHDGPAVFYSGYDKMIVNRNHAAHAEGKKNTWIWHPSLYDAHYSTESKSWQLTLLPFDQPPYSTAHPFMTEDGNTLYFASDRPGGYGGSDIYRATKVNGVWGKPFNLGPVINSPGNEVFPFLSDNILYFASNGQGGLGGLDIFKSPLGASGFAPPVNVGYPINSTADDFSLITKGSGENGYFASSRNGNDDLFEFHKKVEMVKMLAYVYDGKTKQPIANAEAKLMSSTDEDRALTSDKDGYFHFELSHETAYILIGSHEGKSGMINGLALPEEDHQHLVHQIPLFGDSAKIACVAKIQNANGEMQEASTITIFDETTGKIIQEDKNKSIVDFRGEKGHSYRVEIRNKNGDVTTQQVTIAPDETEPKTWSMVIKDATVMIEMAARIFNAENNQSLGGASVKVSTFLEEDIDLVANENGIVEFSLKQGTVYLLVASKDSLKGIYPGEAELTTSKTSITHPVPVYGKPVNPLSFAALITDDKGQPISNVAVTVVDKATGEKIPVKVTNGLISFLGERGKEYDIQVSAEGFKPVATSFTIPPDANKVDEISIVLSKHSPSGEALSMTAHVFKQDDNLPLAGAAVTVISFEADMELKADNDGNVAFTLPEGTAYLMMANRDSYSGMYSGVAGKGTDKSITVLKVATTRLNDKQVTVAGKLTNTQGMMLDEVTVMVTDKTTGERIPAQFKNGLLGFVGIKGHTYTVSVEDKNHRIQTQDVSIPADAGAQENIDLVFDDAIPAKSKEQSVAVTGKLKKADGTMLDEVVVTVFDKTTGKRVPAQFKNGLLTFPAIKGNIYAVSVEDGNHNIQSQTITIPADAGDEENIDIVFGDQQSANKNLVSLNGKLTKADGSMLDEVTVSVFDKTTGKKIPAQFKNGLLTFPAIKGNIYSVSVEDNNHHVQSQDVIIPADAGVEKNVDLVFDNLRDATPEQNDKLVSVTGKVGTGEGIMLDEVEFSVFNKSTGERVPAQFKNGLLNFLAIKGNIYSVSVEDNNHQVQSQDVTIADNAGADENIDLNFDNKGDAATDQVQRLVPVNKRIRTADGNMLDEVTVTVFDKATGERVYSKFENGLLKFAGISGNIYAVSIEDKNHNIQSQDIAIPADATGRTKR